MAFPVVESRSSGATSTTNTTTHSITLPSGIQAGELLLVVFSVDGNPTCTPSAGWSRLTPAANGSTVQGCILWKVAEGGDTLTITTSASEQSSHVSFRISGAAFITGAGANGSSTNSNPPSVSINAGADDFLWIATRSGDSTVVATVAPSSYSDLQTQAAAGTGGASTNTAERNLNAASEDPGTFTSASEQWASFTIAVHPTANADIDSHTDNFDDNSLDAIWENWGGAQVVETNQELQITIPNAAADYYGVGTDATGVDFNLRGTAAWVNLKSISDVTPDELEVEFQVLSRNDADRVFFLIGGSTIYAYKRIYNAQAQLASAAYNATNHQWLRIRESGGTIYWEVATQAQYEADDWQVLASDTVGIDNFRVAYATLDAGCWDTTHGQVVVVFDDYNVAPAGGGDTALTVADAIHAHAAESPALTQAHQLAIQDASHAHSTDAVALAQQHTLSVNDALHAHASESPTPLFSTGLSVADAAHGHTADSPALTQANVLAVNDASHAHNAEQPVLTQAHLLSVQDAVHAHASESPALTTSQILAVQDALHAHVADTLTLFQVYALLINDATHAHSADVPEPVQSSVLSVDDSLHSHSAEALALGVFVVSVVFTDEVTVRSLEDSLTIRVTQESLTIRSAEDSLTVRSYNDSLTIRGGSDNLSGATPTDNITIRSYEDNLVLR